MKEMPRRKLKIKVKPAYPVMSVAQPTAEALREQGRGEIPSDVLGSYTGTPADGVHPEQDADDL